VEVRVGSMIVYFVWELGKGLVECLFCDGKTVGSTSLVWSTLEDRVLGLVCFQCSGGGLWPYQR
jgi:hypothetical protein